MIDGINMVFSKKKMVERVKKLWMIHPIYSCFGKDGKYYDVNENDCITK